MTDTLILFSVFVAVLLLTFLIADYFSSRKEVSKRLQEVEPTYFGKGGRDAEKFEEMISSGSTYVQHYFNVLEIHGPESIQFKLIRAGYFSAEAYRNFLIIRLSAVALTVAGLFVIFTTFFVNVSTVIAALLSLILGGVIFIFCNFILERIGKSRQIAFRKLFPDFMDMLIVCVDAGLSIEAALTRVTREFLLTVPDFGTHLNIMMLEVRAGRRLRDALSNFAARLDVDEAKSLAILFRQSEELGSSVTKTLRVFSKEMRQMRMVKAEEKANSLPIKMLFPMALFLFPTNLIIVLVPVILRVLELFLSLSPR